MKTLTSRGLYAAVFLLAAGLLSACNQEKTEMIAFINVDKLLTESGLLAQEQEHIQQVKIALEKGAELAEEHYIALDKEKGEAARQSDAQILNMQWQTEQASARNAVLARVKVEAEKLQKAKKLTAILPVQIALAMDEKADITAELAAQLRDQKVTFNALPQVTVKAQP